MCGLIFSLEVNTTTETTTEKGTSGKCQKTTENGIIFDETSSGREVTTQCPSGYTGYVKKKCTKQAVWEDGQFSSCTRNILDTLFSSLNGTLNQDSLLNISKTLQETFKDVGQTILSGDIKNVVNIFRDLVDKTKLFKLTVPKVVVEVLTATIDNLLAASNSSWTEISTDGNHDDTGAEMIHSLESFTQSFLQTDQHSFSDISVRKDNIVLEIKQTTSDSIRYPDPTNTEGGKLQESKNEILFSQPAKENMKYSILEFKGVTSKFQTVKISKDFDYGDSASASKTILLNSDVISFSLAPKRQVDALKSNPLRLTFQITNHTLYRQFCVFMTEDLSWSTSGCTTKRTQANQVQCTCTHLSTFAVLMSPDVNEITTEATAKVQNCKAVIENSVIFKDTQPGKSVTAQCPGKDYDGNSIKKCSIQGKWEKTNNNLCVPKVLQKVSQEAENLTDLSTPKEIENMTATVANVYKDNKTIISGDIRKVVDIFAKIGAATTQYKINVTNTTVQNITVTVDKLLSTNENDWKDVSLEDDVSAKLLLSVENITKSVLDSNTTAPEISLNKDNIAVEIKQKTVKEIIYPDPKKSQEERCNITENEIQLSQETSESFKYSIIIYKNVTEKFTIKNFIDDKVDKDQNNKQPTSKFLNSDVISFSVKPEPKSLQTNPLILTFKIRNTTGVRQVCAYLTNDSSWATNGCETKVNKENVTCTCTHLTNFAVLMSPHAVQDTHREVLRFISAVGIVISLIGLAVTIAVYGIMWRYVKSDRSVLHVNLSVALFLGYLVFLVGIDRTHDFITCAIIAGSLHFLFLVVFFVMLAQGLLILKSVTTVSSTSILKFLIILMYGGPLLIVVLSVAITQGEGYGTKYVCWIDNSKGLIWAFAGPAFLVLLSNVVILIHVLRVMQSSQRMMDKDLKKKTMSVFRSISILTPILGITWLFGILSISIDNVLFQYLFAISNSLQGLFIFICQCVLQYQVRDGFWLMIRKYRATTSFDSSSKGASSCQDKGYSESLLQTTEPSNFFENATYDSTVVTSENQL
ncbi:adhesion G protein-coupled receptor L2 [Biomphalaria pfeifferi]|uniref:Adhesion G protein-coupled receptor L2 n=1 Tax=Biomphalaria pfeifferi TaxID=112525 RepID=A0AAD8FCZ2_BIOPF|nr:adhesion G protein-coupled receptor L2 [Biomphalaria pfeifferi]